MSEPPEQAHGVLELHDRGFGFLRSARRNYQSSPGDALVAGPLIHRLGLREGLFLEGPIEPPSRGSGPRLLAIERVEGKPVAEFRNRAFEDLTAIDPHVRLRLETVGGPVTTRVMDLMTPLGKGTRGLIVAPPRTGKTVLLQHIAAAVAANHPEMDLILLLIDERPEEVTEMRHLFGGRDRVEVIASSSDHDAADHVRVAELVVERSRRLVEQGREVFVLLDSLTRLARAYNRSAPGGGRTMSGGVDSRALEVPKRLFGAARAFEEGGSLTVLGTALIDTGSRMDEVIFQEFKGTGNMELVLDRRLADRRIYPALDIAQSGTRKEERLLAPDLLRRVTMIRRTLVGMDVVQATQSLVQKLGQCPDNATFLGRIAV
jgi:transcription termination factor Rho